MQANLCLSYIESSRGFFVTYQAKEIKRIMRDYQKMVQHAVEKTEERYYKSNLCIHDLIESAIILGCTDVVAISERVFLGYLDENVENRPKSTWRNVLNQACSDNCKHYGVVFERKEDGYIAFQPLVWEEMLRVGWINGCVKALRVNCKVKCDIEEKARD